MPETAESISPKRTRKRRTRVSEDSSTVTIKITRNTVVTKARREWLPISEEPRKYAYVDDSWPQLEETKMIEQTVPTDKFDLAKVIKAINSLS